MYVEGVQCVESAGRCSSAPCSHPTSPRSTRLFRIREVADKINKYGGHTQPALAGLKVPIKQTVLGPNHIGILLEDGRAYRCAYSIIPERLDLTKNEPMKRYVKCSNSVASMPPPPGRFDLLAGAAVCRLLAHSFIRLHSHSLRIIIIV